MTDQSARPWAEASKLGRSIISLRGPGVLVRRMQGTAVHPEEQTVNIVELLVPEVKGELAQQAQREIILHGLAAFF